MGLVICILFYAVKKICKAREIDRKFVASQQTVTDSVRAASVQKQNKNMRDHK